MTSQKSKKTAAKKTTTKKPVTKKQKKSSLGTPLSALLSGLSELPLTEDITMPDGELKELPVENLQRGKYQPRNNMTIEGLEELSASIKSQGVIQPIVVRQLKTKGEYEIVAGERRWRAAQMAGLKTIPAIVKVMTDEIALAVSLIENIQRENLNCMEEANAIQQLISEFGMTHQAIADSLGKSRTAISNLLRLLSLHPDVRKLVEHGDIEMGHARALLSLEQDAQTDVAYVVIARNFTVRQTEDYVRALLTPQSLKANAAVSFVDVSHFQDRLLTRFGKTAMIKPAAKGEKGRLVIKYKNHSELEVLLEKLV